MKPLCKHDFGINKSEACSESENWHAVGLEPFFDTNMSTLNTSFQIAFSLLTKVLLPSANYLDLVLSFIRICARCVGRYNMSGHKI